MGTLIGTWFLYAATIIMAVLPPATLEGIPEQLGRNSFFYRYTATDPSFMPSTLIFGPWEPMGYAQFGALQRPARVRIGIVCPGKVMECLPDVVYFEAEVYTYEPEYLYHTTNLNLDSGDRVVEPFGGTHSVTDRVFWTKNLPKNWMPGSNTAPQLPILKYTSGGEFVTADFSRMLTNPDTSIHLGEWTIRTPTSLSTDLHDLIYYAPSAPKVTHRHGRK
jgi:hypothetical protein